MQVAERRVHHHDVLAFLLNLRMRKDTVANEFCDEARGWAVVQLVGVIPLLQLAFVHHADAVADGEGFELVMRHKQRSRTRSLQNAAHLMR